MSHLMGLSPKLQKIHILLLYLAIRIVRVLLVQVLRYPPLRLMHQIHYNGDIWIFVSEKNVTKKISKVSYGRNVLITINYH